MSNYWNKEGVFEEAVADLGDQDERRRWEKMEDSTISVEKLDQWEREYEADCKNETIGFADYLSYTSLRSKVASLEDYLILLSVKGVWQGSPSGPLTQVPEDDPNSAFECILLEAIAEIYCRKTNATFDFWHLYMNGEIAGFLDKFYPMLQDYGIDAVCKWLPSVVSAINEDKDKVRKAQEARRREIAEREAKYWQERISKQKNGH